MYYLVAIRLLSHSLSTRLIPLWGFSVRAIGVAIHLENPILDSMIEDFLESGVIALGLEKEFEVDGLFCYNLNENGAQIDNLVWIGINRFLSCYKRNNRRC